VEGGHSKLGVSLATEYNGRTLVSSRHKIKTGKLSVVVEP